MPTVQKLSNLQKVILQRLIDYREQFDTSRPVSDVLARQQELTNLVDDYNVSVGYKNKDFHEAYREIVIWFGSDCRTVSCRWSLYKLQHINNPLPQVEDTWSEQGEYTE